MNRSAKKCAAESCAVCGDFLHGSEGKHNDSGRLLCKTCHALYGAVRHTLSFRVKQTEARGRRAPAWVKPVLFVVAVLGAAVAAWFLTGR